MEKCSICLKYTCTVSIQDADENNVKWFTKLHDVIPELEWLEEYVICQYCTKQLQGAWVFKKSVISRHIDRRNELKTEICFEDGDLNDTCDTEYICYDDKIYCDRCLKRFTTKTQLRQHNLRIHSEQLPQNCDLQSLFTCYNCNETFNTKDSLIYHIENKHKECEANTDQFLSTNEDNREQFCKIFKGSLSKDEVTNQVHCNYEFDNNVCSLSNNTEATFPSDIKINLNIAEKRKETDVHNKQNDSRPSSKEGVEPLAEKRRGRKPLRKFTCEICNQEFHYVKLVTEHCVSMHGMDKKIVKPYSCEQCDMRFISSGNLDQHRNYHEKNRTHICSLCGKGFITKSDLIVHEYTHYNRRNYKCTICDKAFNTNKNLRTHNLVVHTDRKLWKYACSVCEKRFPLKTNYNEHLRRHTGEKEHVCHICKKPFISKSELQRHIHVHSNIRAFKCSNCDKEYKERRTYLAHLAKKHGIGNAKVTVREKKFVCHICPSQFYDKQKLMRHICSHSGLKPFPCYACDKKFTDKSYLKHHLKTVHNIIEQS